MGTGSSTRLARAVAHDLRAGLHAIGLAVEAARDQTDGPATRYLELAAAECRSLDLFVEDWLALARLDSGEGIGAPEPLDLACLVQGVFTAPTRTEPVVTRTLPAPPEGIPWAVDVPCSAVIIRGDGSWLRHSLERLRDTLRAWSAGRTPISVRVVARPQPELALTGPGLWASLAAAAGMAGAGAGPADRIPARPVIALSLARRVCELSGGTAEAAALPPDRFCFRWRWPDPGQSPSGVTDHAAARRAPRPGVRRG